MTGRGVGRSPLELADREARRQAYGSIYLTTHETMVENQVTKPKSPRQAAPPTSTARPDLTARQREVALLVAEGLSNRAIAETLVVGERTVETHVGDILSKLSFTSRAQIVAWVIQQGWTKSEG